MAITESYTNASRAMVAAHLMRPQLQAVARVVTGNDKLTIVFDGKGSRTDTKNRIWLTPPGDLGRFRTHHRSECSKYDEQGFSFCQACREEEAFFATALHECAHIAYGSGADVEEADINDVRDLWMIRRAMNEFDVRMHDDHVGAMKYFSDEERDHWIAKWISDEGRAHFTRFMDDRHVRDSYMAAASVVSPWLPGLLNAIEDSRVNRMLHSHRPGTTRMFVASTRAIMEDGIIGLDGEPVHWKERDIDQQVLLAALLITSGFEFDFASCLEPEATEVYEDAVLKLQTSRVEDADNIATMFDIAKKILARLQELGYCEDPPSEEGDGDEGDEAGDGSGPLGGMGAAKGSPEGDDASDGDGKGEGGGDKGDITKKAREGHALVLILAGHADEIEEEVNELRGDGKDIHADDIGEVPMPPKWDVVDEEIDLASVHFEHFDEPPRGIADVVEFRFDSKSKKSGSFERIWSRYEDPYGGHEIPDMEGVRWSAHQHLPIMRKIFAENRAVKTTRHLKAGRIDSAALGRKLKTGRDDVFRKRVKPDTRSYAVVIGLDISGSTGSGVLPAMKAAAFAQAEMLAKANIPFEFNCHTGNYNYGGGRAGHNLELVKVKDWDEKWGPETIKRLTAICPANCNLDGHTFEYYRKSVERRKEDVGLILYFTDGAMPAENYHEELEILQREVKHIKRRKNLEMLAIGVGNTEPEEKYGLEMVRYDTVADLPALLKALEKKLTRN